MVQTKNNQFFWVHLCVWLVLIAFFSWQWHQNWKKLHHAFAMRKINQALPPSLFAFLIDPVEKQGGFEASALESYIRYSQTLIKYTPSLFDAYALMGFCYYQQGRISEAIEAFKKAVEVKSDFLLGYYNLGVVYWNQGDRSAARMCFEKFLTQDFVLFRKQLVSSKMVYAVIFHGVQNLDWEIFNRWKEMRAISQKILINANLPLEKLPVRLF